MLVLGLDSVTKFSPFNHMPYFNRTGISCLINCAPSFTTVFDDLWLLQIWIVNIVNYNIHTDTIFAYRTSHCCVGSDEELSDLKTAYVSCKGDIQKIIDSVMVATQDDEQRFKDILNPLIEAKQLPTYKKFVNESASSKKKRQTKVWILIWQGSG